MKSETFYTAQNLYHEIESHKDKISTLKEAQIIRLSKSNKEGERGIALTKERAQCGQGEGELKLFAKVYKIVLDYYQNELKRAEAEFEKLK